MLPELLKEWENFAVITGSAAGALTGLLFVAVSLNRDRIVGHAGLRAEAAQTLVLFILALLLTVLLVIPGMSARTLGVVLVAVSLAAGLTLIILDRNQPGRTRGEARGGSRGEARGRPRTNDGERPKFSDLSPEDQLYRLVDVTSPNLFSVLCVTIAGCLLLAGDNGLYWLAAAVLLALGGGVVNAWLFLTRAPANDTGT
jgi:modulator of FtsH protease